MKKYLLDTNNCIYHMKGLFNLHKKIVAAGIENCYLSEINVAELKYGIECSENKEKNREAMEKFMKLFIILPISSCLDTYAAEKARLRKEGNLIDDFDLLIGCTAISNQLILVTRNTKHFERLSNLEIEDWTD